MQKRFNIMDTVIIQLTTPKTMKLIKELEELNLLRILENNHLIKGNLSEKYAGKLSADIAEDIQNHIIQSREQWDRAF